MIAAPSAAHHRKIIGHENQEDLSLSKQKKGTELASTQGPGGLYLPCQTYLPHLPPT